MSHQYYLRSKEQSALKRQRDETNDCGRRVRQRSKTIPLTTQNLTQHDREIMGKQANTKRSFSETSTKTIDPKSGQKLRANHIDEPCYLPDSGPNDLDGLQQCLDQSRESASTTSGEFQLEGSGGVYNKGGLQSAYDGALMTTAVLRTNEYLGKPPGYEQTQALTITAGPLSVETHALSAKLEGQEESKVNSIYSMTPLKGYNEYKETHQQVRIPQAWAYKKSHETLEALRSSDSISMTTPCIELRTKKRYTQLSSLVASLSDEQRETSLTNLEIFR